MARKIYLIGSMKNSELPKTAIELRKLGHEVFDEWYAPGPDADEYWRDYEIQRGRTFKEALTGAHAKDVFEFDKKWLDWADTVVLLMPAGKSAHLELGYSVGRGKETHIVLDSPDRWDIMYGFASHVWDTASELMEALRV